MQIATNIILLNSTNESEESAFEHCWSGWRNLRKDFSPYFTMKSIYITTDQCLKSKLRTNKRNCRFGYEKLSHSTKKKYQRFTQFIFKPTYSMPSWGSFGYQYRRAFCINSSAISSPSYQQINIDFVDCQFPTFFS